MLPCNWRGWKILVLGMSLSALGLSGCVGAALLGGAAAGAGGVYYMNGEQSQVHAGTPKRVWSATLVALKQMDMRVVNTQEDATGGSIEARRADNTAVTIKEEPAGKDTTQVKIRVGTLGDKAESEAIQSRIDANLKA